jgi:hypothetical protein
MAARVSGWRWKNKGMSPVAQSPGITYNPDDPTSRAELRNGFSRVKSAQNLGSLLSGFPWFISHNVYYVK